MIVENVANWRSGLSVPSSVISTDAGRAPTCGRISTPSAASRDAVAHSSLSSVAVASSVTGRPVSRAMCSTHDSSSGWSTKSEMISIVPWPLSRSASPMAIISSASACVPGTTWPALLRWP